MRSVSRQVAATPAAAWDLLVSTRTWPLWGPSVVAVEPAEATIRMGLQGRVRTPVGVWLPFRITSYDPPHSWSWSVLGISATSHTVEAVPGGCRISFGVPTPALPYLVVCRLALNRITELLEPSAAPGSPPELNEGLGRLDRP